MFASNQTPSTLTNDDRVPSDVDVVGFHPALDGNDKVFVVSCKSYQLGFNAGRKLSELRGEVANPKRATWRHFRELWIPKWSEAFRAEIERVTGTPNFTYRIAVTRLTGSGNPEDWANDPTIRANLRGCSFGFLTLEEMWRKLLAELRHTPASSEIGRLAQLLKAAGLTASASVAPPDGPVEGSDAAVIEELESEV